jgi:hypothetical protein
VPISFRPALLAGLSRAIAHPTILDAIRDETIFRGRTAFERLCEEAMIGTNAKNLDGFVLKISDFLAAKFRILKPRWL